jgi:hypothetical protein
VGATSPLAGPPSLISTKKRRTNISVVGGSFSVHCSVMENRPFFHVDSKSYEIMREGNSKGINIIERGRNHQSNVVLGGEGTRWFQAGLHEVAHLLLDHKFQKTFREGAKVFLFQKKA